MQWSALGIVTTLVGVWMGGWITGTMTAFDDPFGSGGGVIALGLIVTGLSIAIGRRLSRQSPP